MLINGGVEAKTKRFVSCFFARKIDNDTGIVSLLLL